MTPDIVYGSRHFVPVTRNLCRSSIYDTSLKFENLPVIVTGRKRILSVTHEIVPESDRSPAVVSCTVLSQLRRMQEGWNAKRNIERALIRMQEARRNIGFLRIISH